MNNTKVVVLGAGSWGTALAVLLCHQNCEVTLWSHRKEQALELAQKRIHESKLPGIKLPDELEFQWDLEKALKEKEIVVFAVPSTATRNLAKKAAVYMNKEQIAVCVSKGIEKGTLATQCDILGEELPTAHICVLSGPSHAEEVVRQLPTVVVAGAKEETVANRVQEVFMNDVFRVYTSSDVYGIEIGASLKNVIALAAGMSDGLGYGDNAKAALITRAVKEMTALAVAMGGKAETLSGLAGIGDLIVTCQSKHSRNRKAGMLIGQGLSKEEAMDKVNMVVEGVFSAESALALGEKYQVELPIIEQVNQVLFHGLSAKEAVRLLMIRDKKPEDERLEWNSKEHNETKF